MDYDEYKNNIDTTDGYDTIRYEPCHWDPPDESSDYSIDDDEWSTTNSLQTFPFTGTTAVQPNEARTPYDFYKLMYNRNFMDQLVKSTNNSILKYRLKNEKHIVDTTVDELNIFFGLTLFVDARFGMDPWTLADEQHISFDLYMTAERFSDLKNFLCFKSDSVRDEPESQDEGDSEDEVPREFLQSIIMFFNDLMKTLSYPTQTLAIHESAIFRKNRFHTDFIRGERYKENDMLYALIDQNKIHQKLHMHFGFYDDSNWEDSFKKIVTELTQDYLECGHCLYINNYYNTISLTEDSLSKKTHVTGLLAKNRSGNPGLVRSRVPKGTCEYMFRRGICVSRYERTNYISTEYDGRLTTYIDGRRVKKIIKIPKVLKKITRTLSSILKGQDDAFVSNHEIKFHWYKKFFFHILQIMVYNSWRLYSVQSDQKLNFQKFRSQISRVLLKLDW